MTEPLLSEALTRREAEATNRALVTLSSVTWAIPLLRRLQDAGGIAQAPRELLFEVRFAAELHRAGAIAQYEYPTAVGGSTVDFRVEAPVEWLIEIVSVRASDAVRQASSQTELRCGSARLVYQQHVLSTDAAEPRQGEEAEIIRVAEKIEAKVFADGTPIKFPRPTNTMHVIVVDMRGYLGGGGGDFYDYDYREIAYGGASVPSQARHWWTLPSGERTLVRGLFEPENPRPGARVARERIHFLGFTCEDDYHDGEIRDTGHYFANPCLFPNETAWRSAFDSYPLRTARTPEPPASSGEVSALLSCCFFASLRIPGSQPCLKYLSPRATRS